MVGVAFGQLVRFPVTNGVAITLLDIGVALFVGNFLIQSLITKRKIKADLSYPIFLFTAACVISLLVNLFLYTPLQIGVASLYLLRWLLYAGVYFAVRQETPLKQSQLIYFILVTAAIQLLVGIWQFYFMPDLRVLYFLNWDDHLYRLVGVYIDPNYQGAMFVLFLIVVVSLILHHIKHINWKTLWLCILMLATLLETVLTYSRSALVMLFGSLVSFFMLYGNKKILAGIFGIALLFVIALSNTYIEGLNPFRTASIFARLSSMKEAIVIIKDNPVFGVGFNTFRYAQNKYGFRVSEKWQVSHADAGTDNSYLFITATAGIIGLLTYLYLLYRMLLLAKSKIGKKSMVPLVAFVSIIGLMVDSLFVNSLFYPYFMFWMWMLLGFTENS
jgi:hypothetical protein